MRMRQSPTIPFGIVGALFPTTFLEIAVYNNVRVHHATRGHRGSLAHVRLPRTKNFEKNFPQKTHRNTHDEEKR